MSVVDSKVFRDDDGEFVILPTEIAYGADIDVTIRRFGNVITVTPKISDPDQIERSASSFGGSIINHQR